MHMYHVLYLRSCSSQSHHSARIITVSNTRSKDNVEREGEGREGVPSTHTLLVASVYLVEQLY